MLRMFYCQWCFDQFVSDDYLLHKKPMSDRMALSNVCHCPYCKKENIVSPMVKDRNGDWYIGSEGEKEVKPPVMWH